ncbi:hypothetical protein [Streptomyces sp. SD31]|uniref:hypothetical protein n=1 Tax=Streptomyces sp. SD31 TaxID=3452208 RepID=UPI003F8B3589
MSRERSLTLKVLTAAARDLSPVIEELNRQQRHAARVEEFFVVIEHGLSGPAEELRPWSSERDVLYRFEKQYFVGDWDVESGEGTLGYSIDVRRCYTGRKGLAKRVFGGWRHRSVWQGTSVRLLVVDDGVPALFWDRKRYSGDVEGWRQILRDIDWPELHP